MADDPIEIFRSLFERAAQSAIEPDAMVVATVDTDGRPSARYVLLKAFDQRGFVFYTNLESRKARALRSNPSAALCFYWPSIEKQVRIEGAAERVAEAEADAYFATQARRFSDQRLGIGAKRYARLARRAGTNASPKHVHDSRTAPSVDRRSGRGSGSCPGRSSSGRASHHAFTCGTTNSASATSGCARFCIHDADTPLSSQRRAAIDTEPIRSDRSG
jgi:general stress protein 26